MKFTEVLKQLNADNSRLTKEKVLKDNENDVLRSILLYTYNPEFVYGIKKIPAPKKHGSEVLDSKFWFDIAQPLLDRLNGRHLTGNAARDEVVGILEQLTEDDAAALRLVITRDLKCGVSAKTINNAFGCEWIPQYPYMRCSLMKGSNWDSWDWSKGVYIQEKMDGAFANVLYDSNGQLTVATRSGSIYPVESFSEIYRVLHRAGFDRGNVLHGELLVTDEFGKIMARKAGNGVLNSLLSGGSLTKGQNLRLIVWDMIPEGNYRQKLPYKVPYSQRIKYIQGKFNQSNTHIQPVSSTLVYTKEDAMRIYAAAIKAGKEGVVAKSPDMIWENRTSKDQVKIKMEEEVDLRMQALTEGKGKFEDLFGSVTCTSDDGKIEVNVSGFKDAERKFIFDNWADVKGQVVTVKANDLICGGDDGAPWRLFLPVFVEIRNDKDETDTLERVKEIFYR